MLSPFTSGGDRRGFNRNVQSVVSGRFLTGRRFQSRLSAGSFSCKSPRKSRANGERIRSGFSRDSASARWRTLRAGRAHDELLRFRAI